MNNTTPTPAWLTDILRQAGALPQGAVIAVEERQSDAFNSQLVFLRLTYSADAPPDLPMRFVLKRNIDAEWAMEAGAEEVKFYQLVATLPDHPPVLPPCYAVGYNEASGSSYLLLADLSESHAPPETREQEITIETNVLSPENMVCVIDTLAQFHAYWWQHPLLDSGQFPVGYWSRNAERFALYQERRQQSWASLVAAEGDWLPTNVRELYERVFACLPHHWEKYLEPRFRNHIHLTLVHGDAYFANFLCPKPGQTGSTYLLDWQSPVVDLAGYDLANLLATFWTPAQRHSGGREQALLQRYYATLCANGVTGYTWDDLLLDYRHGLIYWLLVPVQDCYGGAGNEYWWPKMQCLVAAFQDWECERLLVSTEKENMSMNITPATSQKRQELIAFIERNLASEAAIQGVVGIGSIATGQMRPGSDIDAVIFFDPYDPYIVPAEAIWLPADGSFHSIFSKEPGVQESGIQFDFTRCALAEWADPAFIWPEGRRAELVEGWLAFDRTGVVSELIASRTAYTDAIRQERLDEALVWLDQHLKWDDPQEMWGTLGPAIAHDRLHAAYDYLVQALFAYNRRWRAWRNREMSYLLQLPWMPPDFDRRVLTVLNAPSHDFAGYQARFAMLRTLFDEVVAQLVNEGLYAQDDPVGEAFVRRAEEPGRAWNMAAWNAKHHKRQRRS